MNSDPSPAIIIVPEIKYAILRFLRNSILIERNKPLVIPVENPNFPPRFKCQSINNLEIKIAVNKEVKIPIKRVVANPLIGPDPNTYSIKAVNPVVILASKIEDKALLNPSLTDSF